MSATILIVAEHDGKKLNQSTAKCVSCARTLADAEIRVVVLAADAADAAAVAAQAAQLAGVARVLTVENPANLHPLAAVLAPQIAALAAPFTHVLGPSTTFGKDLMARLAGLLEAPQVSDIMAIESPTRWAQTIAAPSLMLKVFDSLPSRCTTIVPSVSTPSTSNTSILIRVTSLERIAQPRCERSGRRAAKTSASATDRAGGRRPRPDDRRRRRRQR